MSFLRRLRRPSRRHLAAGVAIFAALALLGALAPRGGFCFDPTEACNWSVFTVVNDTRVQVSLRPCSHHCGRGDRRLDPVEVDPGRASPQVEYGGVYALTRTRSWWEIRDLSGFALGCLVLYGHRYKRNGDVVRVTQARLCRAHQRTTRPVNAAVFPGRSRRIASNPAH